MLNKKLIVFFLTTISVFTINGVMASPVDVAAQSSSSVWDEINTLESQMQSLSGQINSEQSQLQNISGRIQSNSQRVTTLQSIISQKQQLIQEKENQINLYNQSIQSEQAQINTLNTKINSLYTVFVARAKASYENSFVNPLFLSIGNKSIVDVFVNLEYFSHTRKEDSQLLSDMKNSNYTLQGKLQELDVEQSDLKNAQSELVTEKKDLLSQQSTLQAQISNDTATSSQVQQKLNNAKQQYQQLVNEINNLQVATFSGNGGCKGGDYWYFNQQCYGRLNGMYGTSIDMTYGCLITDIAMVATKELGKRFPPEEVASLTYFSGNYMEAWPAIPGLSPIDLGYDNISGINNELAQGYPVIVYLSAPSGEHWIVFDRKISSNNWDIQDPWYGSHLSFSGTDNGAHEYYSASEIGEAFVLR